MKLKGWTKHLIVSVIVTAFLLVNWFSNDYGQVTFGLVAGIISLLSCGYVISVGFKIGFTNKK